MPNKKSSIYETVEPSQWPSETLIPGLLPSSEAEAVTVSQVAAGLSIKQSSAREALNKLVLKGQICRTGVGRNGNPYRYFAQSQLPIERYKWDLTGMRFGNLFVKEFHSRQRRISVTGAKTIHLRVWKCVCNCGNECLKTTPELRLKGRQHCGCIPNITVLGRPRKDLVGQRFGRLVVVGKTWSYCKSRNRYISWECRCDCGNISSHASSNLLFGASRSCGCLREELNASRVKTTAALHRAFAGYRLEAKKRNHVFDLTESDFEKIVLSNCHYCGNCPDKIMKSGPNILRYSGIDRFNNSLGYTHNNSVPCCKQCNRAKLDYSYPEFIAWIRRVNAHLVGTNQYEFLAAEWSTPRFEVIQ